MKKTLSVILTILFGLLTNTIICAVGVLAYPAHVVLYIIAAAALISIYSPTLIAVVGNAADKSGVSRKTLYICAQAPILALSLVYFISELVTYDPPGSWKFGGWRYVGDLGLSLGIAIFTLITAVLTTTASFIIAAMAKKKDETSKGERK